uniref:(California timema) hypothetical protein n=1 Tax=Timema californicum TaxID=61474 RepID=A0A7R9P3C0_TIMCA|nr:unnamed protein product [Timema californicum]
MLLLYLSLPRSTPVSLHPSSLHIVSQHQHIVFSTPNEVFIGVENINDNTPLTEEPVYYISVLENTSAVKVVLHMRVEDRDFDPGQELSYLITAGNDDKFFSLDKHTGMISLDLLGSSPVAERFRFYGVPLVLISPADD